MRALRLPQAQAPLRFLMAVAGLVAVVLVIACLYWGRSLLIPAALAVLLTFLLAPVVDLFQRKGLNRIASVLIVVGLAGVLLVGLGWVVAAQATGMARDLRHNPTYRQNIKQKIDDLRGAGKGGFLDNIQATVNEILGEFGPASPPPGKQASNQAVVIEAKEPALFVNMQAALEPLLEPLAAAGLVIVLVIFMLLKHEDLRNRVVGLFGEGRLTVTTKALADAGQRVSRYLLMLLVINGSYGLAVGVGLLLMGVPYAFLWGFLAAVLRFVPYIGPWLGAVFPVATSLVAFSGWTQPILVVGLFLICEILSNMVLEPMLYGQSIGVSQVALLVATGFWAWLWGPIGLVLAAPLTVCLIVLGRHVPALRIIAMLLGDAPPLEAPASYYQRLLAHDEEEALQVTKEFVREHGLEKAYDEMFIPALLLALKDRKQGKLSAEDELFILEKTRKILVKLMSLESAAKRSAPDGSPVGAGGDRAATPIRILACPAHYKAEELILSMLTQLMARSGYEVEVMPAKTLPWEIVARARKERPALIFIAALPGSLAQARHLCSYLRKEFRPHQIVVGYWGRKVNFDKALVRFRKAGAGYLITSLLQCRGRISSLTQPPAGAGSQHENAITIPALSAATETGGF